MFETRDPFEVTFNFVKSFKLAFSFLLLSDSYNFLKILPFVIPVLSKWKIRLCPAFENPPAHLFCTFVPDSP